MPRDSSACRDTERAAIREPRVEGHWIVATTASDTEADRTSESRVTRDAFSFAAALDRVPDLVGDHLRKALAPEWSK
jgi:hypothetical protein